MSFYEVSCKFNFRGSRGQLVGVTLHTSSVYYPFLVGSPVTFLEHSRFFHTRTEAKKYIENLFKRFPDYGLVIPILDSLQPELF